MAPYLMVRPRCMETSVLSHVPPQGRYTPVWEMEVKSPKQQRGIPGSPVKLWHLSKPLHRVPDHADIITGCRVIPAERMGIHPVSALSWPSTRRWKFNHLPLTAWRWRHALPTLEFSFQTATQTFSYLYWLRSDAYLKIGVVQARMAKSWPGACHHHTYQAMIRNASYERSQLPWAEMNRATPTHAPGVVPDIEGTTNRNPETESWGATLPALEVGQYDRHTQSWTPMSVYFWKALWHGHRSATWHWDCWLFLLSNTSQGIWPSSLSNCSRYPTFLSEVVPSLCTCQTLSAVHCEPP